MMRPIPIPQLEAQTDDEKADWAHAERIREQNAQQQNRLIHPYIDVDPAGGRTCLYST